MQLTAHPAIWIAPAALLVLAIFPLPYSFYQFLRLIVTAAACYLAYAEWQTKSGQSIWAISFAAIALLFNPLIPVHLDKSIWRWIDAAVAGLFLLHWYTCERPRQRR